ncbi:MAG: methyltransferase domain-containing protein [Gammaproteobacteria bacterium]|nr:methyltransferase domain-containing protein [Gammaproteobacteria bacterium]
MSTSKQLAESLKDTFDNIDVPARIERLRQGREQTGESPIAREDHAQSVNDYYDIATDLAQWGWSQSLHFAPIKSGESTAQAIARHEDFMIERLQLDSSKRVVDVGCGIGGPMRRVAQQSGANVLLINNNERQLDQAKKLNQAANVDHLAEYLHCNFMDMGCLEENSFDAAYAIESTCHAPDKIKAFEQIYRILKPGGLFWGQEFGLTDTYDENNPTHRSIVTEIVETMALGEVFHLNQIAPGLAKAGFKIHECEDLALKSDIPWYAPFKGGYERSLHSFRATPLQRSITLMKARLGEVFGAVPKGTVDLIKFLEEGATALIRAGELGIVTILCCFLVEKPR